MKKKIIIIVIVVLVLVSATGGGLFAYQSYQNKKLVVDVTSVSNLNMGYWESDTQSYGTVTNNISQDIYLDSDQTVSKVYVEEGQQVAIGDKLLEYDTTQSELNLEMKKLEIQGIENDITLGQRKLTELKNTTPVADTPVQPEQPEQPAEPEQPAQPEQPSTEVVEEKSGDAYNYVSRTAKPYDGEGSEESPYRFLCTKSAYVVGNYLNYLKSESKVAVFEIREDDKEDGTLISSWTVNGAAMEATEDDSKWSVLDRQEITDEPDTEEPDVPDVPDEPDEPETEEPETETKETYTAAELKKAINKQENDLKDLDINKRTAELELKKLEEECNNGVVTATINGVVKTVQDLNNLSNDGSAFLSVSGSDGLYISGTLNEMLLETVKVGQAITATSWETGATVNATITEISPYPNTGNYYGGDGNPNSSYYPFTAYVEDASGLSNGDGVQISMSTSDANVDSSKIICIDRAYVRTENGKSYVYKADENNRLKKQYITTGKIVYGQEIIIKGGLSLDDRIAFPYGKTAKEGVKVTDSDDSDTIDE